MTVPTELVGAKGDILAARVITPIIAVMIYGAYKFISLGSSWDHYLYTYIPLSGGIASIIGFFTYLTLITYGRKISWMNLLMLLGFIPYFFSLYVIGFLGLYMIYTGIVPVLSIWSIIMGLFWIAVGYQIINLFYLIMEIIQRHDLRKIEDRN